MKRIMVFILMILMLTPISACGKKPLTWQEQYDLGVRYLSEGNYEEAIIAFTAAIEIDPQQVESYASLANAYWEQGQDDLAMEILRRGYDATKSEYLNQLISIGQLNSSSSVSVQEAAQGLYTSIQAKDRDSMAEYLERWLTENGFWGLGESSSYIDIDEILFDGERFCLPQDGYGLFFFSEFQIYLGEMSQGVPNGAGVLITVQTIYPDEWYDGFGGVEYCWIDGYWENGKAVGEAEIWSDHSRRHDSADTNQSSITTIKVSCSFGSDEIIEHGNVEVSWTLPGDTHNFEYEIYDGKIDYSDWTDWYGFYYKDCALHASCDAAITCEYEGIYKNPYTWGSFDDSGDHDAMTMFMSGGRYKAD